MRAVKSSSAELNLLESSQRRTDQVKPLAFPQKMLLLAVLGLALASCSKEAAAPTVDKSSPAASAPSPAPTVSAASPPPSPAADTKKSEETKAIETSIVTVLSPKSPSPITAANCPNLEKIEAGKTFDCTLTVAEGTFPATVTLKDTSGNFSVNTKNIVSLPAVERQLVESIKSQNNLDVKADCGGKIKLFKSVGETFECKVIQPDDKTGSATATVETLAGDVGIKWALVK